MYTRQRFTALIALIIWLFQLWIWPPVALAYNPGQPRPLDISTPVGKIDDEFRVLLDGAATYSINLWTPPGRLGIEPNLRLTYNSRGGDGFLGIRWHMEGLSAIRRVNRIAREDGVQEPVTFGYSADRFELDGNRLAAISGEYGEDGTEYRTKHETFSKIISYKAEAGDVWGFTVYKKDGLIYEYGADSPDSLCSSNAVVLVRHGFPRTWLLREVRDRNGNFMTFHYQKFKNDIDEATEFEPPLEASVFANPDSSCWVEDMEVLIDSIHYTGNYPRQLPPRREVRFTYDRRTDVRHGYFPNQAFPPGFGLGRTRTQLSHLLTRVEMLYDVGLHTEHLLRRYELSYGQSAEETAPKDYLEAVTEFDGNGIAKPATYFEWSGISLGEAYQPTVDTELEISQYFLPVDVNIDGYTDIVYLTEESGNRTGIHIAFNDNGRFTRDVNTDLILEIPIKNNSFRFGIPTDYNLDGFTDILLTSCALRSWHVLQNNGRGNYRLINTYQGDNYCDLGNNHQSLQNVYIDDFTGDGLKDLIAVYHRRLEPPTFESYVYVFRPMTEDGFGDEITLFERPWWRYPIWERQRDRIPEDFFVLDIDGDGAKEFVTDVLSPPLSPTSEYKACSLSEASPTEDDFSINNHCRKTGLPVRPFYESGWEKSINEYLEKRLFLDVNGDGLDDVLYFVFFSPKFQFDPAHPAPRLKAARLWINTGGHFIGGSDGFEAILGLDSWDRIDHPSEMWPHPFDFLDFHAVTATDLNGDGREDLLVADTTDCDNDTSWRGLGLFGKWRILYSSGQPLSYNEDGDQVGYVFSPTNTEFLVPETEAGFDFFIGRNDYQSSTTPMKIDIDGDLLDDLLFATFRTSGTGDVESEDPAEALSTILSDVILNPEDSDFHLRVVKRVSTTPEVITTIRDGLIGLVPPGEPGHNSTTWSKNWTHKITYRPTTDPVVYSHDLHPTAPPVDKYNPDTGPTEIKVHPRMLVVSEYERDNETDSPPFHYTYSYHNSRFDRFWGWLGFGQVVITEPTTGKRTTNLLDGINNCRLVDLNPECWHYEGATSNRAYPYGYFPYLGLVTRRWIDVPLGDGKVQEIFSVFQYQTKWTIVPGRDAYKAYYTPLSNVRESVYECYEDCDRSDAHWNVVKETITRYEELDDYGNVGQIAVEHPGESAREVIVTDYLNDTDHWLIGLPERIETTSTARRGARKQRTLALSYEPARNRIHQTIQEPDDPEHRVTTTFTYYPDGQVQTSRATFAIDGVAETRPGWTYEYDSVERIFPTRISNALGHATQQWFHQGLGVPIYTLSPSGLLDEWGYDGFGRLTHRRNPSGQVTSIAYSSRNVSSHQSRPVIQVTSNTGSQVTQLFDRLLRKRQTESVGFNGDLAVQQYFYNEQGLLRRVNLPRWEREGLAARNYISYDYDPLGRLLSVVDSADHTIEFEYDGLTVQSTDEKGTRRTTNFNTLGQVNEIIEAVGTDDETHTYYEYGSFGQLTFTRDHKGNEIIIESDAYGHPLTLNDPDSGISEYRYNPLGEMVTTWDARGEDERVTFERDPLGRVRSRKEWRGDTIAGEFEWHYDDRYPGSLDWMTGPDGNRRSFWYRRNGLVDRVETQIRELTFTQAFTYNLGRIATVRNDLYRPEGSPPADFTVAYHYNPHGYLNQITNGDGTVTYYETTQSDPAGRQRSFVYGNGVETGLEFDELTGKLEHIYARLGDQQFQNLEYKYEDNGNLYQRIDHLEKLTETFSYDPLNRVTSAAVNREGTPLSTQTFAYNAIGNLTNKSDVGHYIYSLEHPHAVVGIGSSSADLTERFDYDEVGNLIEKPGFSITYTRFNKPQQFSAIESPMTVELQYDAIAQRVYKRVVNVRGEEDRATETYYPSAFYELQTFNRPDGQHLVHKGYVVGFGRVIATLTLDEDTAAPSTTPTWVTTYFHYDHLGSPNLLTQETGAPLHKEFFDTFGQRRIGHWQGRLAGSSAQLSSGGSENTIGFTGHEQDESYHLGLINMGGREYDPRLGRFLQADSLVPNPISSQSFNRYSYVQNNPLRWIDPSGYELEEVGSYPIYGDEGEVVGEVTVYREVQEEGSGITPEERMQVESQQFTRITVRQELGLGGEIFLRLTNTYDVVQGAMDIASMLNYTQAPQNPWWVQGLGIAGAIVAPPALSINHALSTASRIDYLVNLGTYGYNLLMEMGETDFQPITSPLTTEAKDQLRDRARAIAESVLGRRPAGSEVHHRIPLKFAHLFPNEDPNRLENLIVIADPEARPPGEAQRVQSFHQRVHDFWMAHLNDLRSSGITPSREDIESIADQIDEQIRSEWGSRVHFLGQE